MVRAVDKQPIFSKLANTVAVILTTIFSGLNGASLDRLADESSQWNAFGSHREAQTIAGPQALGTPLSAQLMHRKRSKAADDATNIAASTAQPEFMRYEHAFEAAPHAAFGAGSTALSALGHNASHRQVRS